MIFHNICFGIWNKMTKAKETEERNKRECARNVLSFKKIKHTFQPSFAHSYLRRADVSPAYYRVGDPGAGIPAGMVSGPEERAAMRTEQQQAAAGGKVKCECGEEIDASARFCEHCGSKNEPPPPAPAARTGCPSCGFAEAKGKFCAECGAKL